MRMIIQYGGVDVVGLAAGDRFQDGFGLRGNADRAVLSIGRLASCTFAGTAPLGFLFLIFQTLKVILKLMAFKFLGLFSYFLSGVSDSSVAVVSQPQYKELYDGLGKSEQRLLLGKIILDGVKHDAITCKFGVHPGNVCRCLNFLRSDGVDV